MRRRLHDAIGSGGGSRARSAAATVGALALVAALALPAPSSGQDTGSITGTVRASSGADLGGARVSVLGTELVARTAKDGTFRIDEAPVGDIEIRVEADGFARSVQVVEVRPGSETAIEVELMSMAEALETLTMSGRVEVREEERTRQRGTFYPEVQPGETLLDVLDRIPGVEVVRSSGQVGAGARIRLRGVKSLALSNEPLVFVDGIQVLSESDQWGTGATAQSVLETIDPTSVESIQVLRGPTDAAGYGLGAANGVILISTKAGRRD